MKKVLVLILALVLCISAFAVVGCSKKEEYDLDSATAYVKNLYKKYLDADTPSDFTLVSQFVSDGVTYTITWTTNSDKVKVVEGDKEVTIDVDEKSEEDVSYILTATIKAPDGTTKTLEFKCKVPKFAVTSHDDYIAAKSGDTVIVQGVVVAIHSESVNDGKNQLYLADLSGEGGYYVYYLTSQDPVKLGIELGMTVQVTGQKDIYNGVHELKEGVAEIIDSTIKEVTPVDITETFKNAEDAKADALLNKVGMLVTIKGVEITTQDFSSDAYLKFRLGNIESYIRAKTVPTSVSDDDLASIKKGHSEHKAWLANVTGVVTAYNGAIYLEPVSANAFEYISEITRTDAEKVEVEKNDLTISSTTIKSNSTITLPTAGTTYTDVKISWASDNDAVAITDKGAVVTLGSEQIKVTLTATLTLGETTVTKTIELTLEPAPTLVPTIVENPVAGTAYKFHFKQTQTGDELYFNGKTAATYYGGSTSNADEAVDVYLEETDGGFYMYFNDGSTKTYITSVKVTGTDGKEHINFKLTTDKPESVVTIDKDLNAPVIKIDDDTTIFFGTYGDKTTFGASLIKYSSTSYVAHLVVMAEAPAGGDNTGDDNNGGNTGDDNNGGNTGDNTDVEINYGTQENPISTTEAVNACAGLAEGSASAEKFYVTGKITSIGEATTFYKNVYITDGTTDLLIYTVNLSDGIENISVGDTVVVYGYIKNYSGTIEFTSNNGEYVYIISVQASSDNGGGDNAGDNNNGGDNTPSETKIELTVDSLGIPSQTYLGSSDSIASATVGGVTFNLIQIGNYGNGIQMRDKNGNTSLLWNATAFSSAIARIELVYSESMSTYNNSDAVIFSFGTSSDSLTYETKLSTEKDVKTYTITPDSETYTFFKLEHDLGYTMYWESITIVLVDGTVING